MRTHALVATLVLAVAPLARAQQQPYALPLPAGEPQRALGLPALPTGPGGAKLDLKTVADYIKARNLPRNLSAAAEVKVLSVDRVTVDEAKRRVGIDTTGFLGNEPVGLVMLGGTLVFSGPPPSQPATFTKGYVVFDALTGNLLMLGTRP